MDIKIIFTIIATVIGTVAFLPYLRDIFLLKTKPHIYTWLIWLMTQGTAVFGIWYGGGSWGALNLMVGTLFLVIVLILSFKYGTKNITKGDTFILIMAFCAILVWWQLDKPLLAIVMVSIIDLIGYVPSFRKSYADPWSETIIAWVAFAASDVFALLALSEYNTLTVTYLAAITLANIALSLFCLFRRSFVLKPKLN